MNEPQPDISSKPILNVCPVNNILYQVGSMPKFETSSLSAIELVVMTTFAVRGRTKPKAAAVFLLAEEGFGGGDMVGYSRLIDVEEEKEHKIELQDGAVWTLAKRP